MYGGFLCSQAESCCRCLEAVTPCTTVRRPGGLRWQCMKERLDGQYRCALQRARLSLRDYLQKINKCINESTQNQFLRDTQKLFLNLLHRGLNGNVNKKWPLGTLCGCLTTIVRINIMSISRWRISYISVLLSILRGLYKNVAKNSNRLFTLLYHVVQTTKFRF